MKWNLAISRNCRSAPHLTLACGLVLLTAILLCGPVVAAEGIQVDSVLIRLIDEVSVPARAIGSLVEVHVSEGIVVKQGQRLAQIDDTEAQLDHQRAEYELEIADLESKNDVEIRSAMKTWAYAQAHLERLRRADQAQPRSVSDSELQKAQLEFDQAQFQLERGKNELQKAQVRRNSKANELAQAQRSVEVRKILAPISGVVVKVLHHPGEWVKPGEQIFRIVRTDRLRVEGFVRASDVAVDLRGKPVSVVPELGNTVAQTFSGKIVFVSPEIDPVNGQVRVWAEIENSTGHLRPGLRAKMTIKPN